MGKLFHVVFRRGRAPGSKVFRVLLREVIYRNGIHGNIMKTLKLLSFEALLRRKKFPLINLRR